MNRSVMSASPDNPDGRFPWRILQAPQRCIVFAIQDQTAENGDIRSIPCCAHIVSRVSRMRIAFAFRFGVQERLGRQALPLVGLPEFSP